ncbi:MAG TPA: threonine/serine exporter family protein, partial [Chitinophagaceae bacterium]|nr:threonine/serine exporter family protein [Chitinophagaceae bacterium]
VNFKTISGISRLSWKAVENNLSVHQVREELNQLLALPHYPRIIILIFVSLAGSAFCFSFGGKIPEMIIAFGATFCGLFIRQEAVKNKFNPYISVFFGSLVASLFAGAFIKAGLNINFEHAFATSVLFLIPGVPLINSFTDLIDGNILNGIVRGINALMFSMAIAFGLLVAMLIYNLN